MKKHIGIVIVSYNVKHFLSQCLHSIFQSNAEHFTYDVWVVDNNSVDGSVEMLDLQYPQVHIIINHQNVGFARANNQALEQIKADYILILNPDTILEEKTLAECLNFMEQTPQCGALGVRMIDGSGTFLPESKRALPTVWNSFFKLSYLADIFPKSKAFNAYYLGHLSEWETHKVEVLCGAFMFVRGTTLDETGFFDDDFFMYGEDIDLSYRILQRGWEIYYSPISTIVHFKGESTKKSSLQYHKHFYGAMQIYVEKHYSKSEANIFGKFIQLGIVLRGILSYISKILKTWIWPLMDGILMFQSLKVIATAWASYRFDDPNYYDNVALYQYFTVYIAIWILGLWLFGRYSMENTASRRAQGVFSGTIVILVVYALLPEDMRSSRAILVIGAVVAFLVTSFSTIIASLGFVRSNTDNEMKITALVGSISENQKMQSMLVKNTKSKQEFYAINPYNDSIDNGFYGTLKDLPSLVSDLKINEIVFSSDAIGMHKIISTMSAIGNTVTYKIGSDQSLAIIGSSNKSSQGNILVIDRTFSIQSGLAQRTKRLIDIVSSISVLAIFPLIWIITGMNAKFFSNAFSVLFNQKTWIGYGGTKKDYGNLPIIKPCVIAVPLCQEVIPYSDDYASQENRKYALQYKPWTDLKLIFLNAFRLSN